jgi:tetratricopeptide (TPR) repeat protein
LLSQDEPDADLAALAAQVGRFMFFAGEGKLAMERLERALELAERLSLPETLMQALNTKGVVLQSFGRSVEGRTLVRRSLDLALEMDKPSAALRAYYNLADMNVQDDLYEQSAAFARDGLELARRVGNRYWEWSLLGNAYVFYALGEWDEVAMREQLLPEGDWARVRLAFTTLLTSIVPLWLHRGQAAEVQRYTQLFAALETSADVQERAQVLCAEAAIAFAEGRYDVALSGALAALATRDLVSLDYEAVREAFVIGVDAALALNDDTRAKEILSLAEGLPPGEFTPFFRHHSRRFAARIAAAKGDLARAETLFAEAADGFAGLPFPFYRAVTLLEYAEALNDAGRSDDSRGLLETAEGIFERLDAKPWLQRVAKARAANA